MKNIKTHIWIGPINGLDIYKVSLIMYSSADNDVYGIFANLAWLSYGVNEVQI